MRVLLTFALLAIPLSHAISADPAVTIDTVSFPSPSQSTGVNTPGVPFPDITCGSTTKITRCDTQAKLDALKTCTHMIGSLTITGPLIANLSSLANLNLIDGTLEIMECSNLTSLTGPEGLQSVGGQVLIHDNNNLEIIQGFSNLSQIVTGLSIYKNPALTNITFPSLKSVANSTNSTGLRVYNNPSLSIVENTAIANVGTSLYIANNIALISLVGLSPVQPNPIENLTIYGNSLITNLTALSILTTPEIPAIVTITSNHLLTTLDGLEGLTRISQLTVNYNVNLVSIAALTNVSWGPGPITVNNNQNLCILYPVNQTITREVLPQDTTLQLGCGALSNAIPGLVQPPQANYSTSDSNTSSAMRRAGMPGWSNVIGLVWIFILVL